MEGGMLPSDLWQPSTWRTLLLSITGSRASHATRVTWERAVRCFPTAPSIWLGYLRAEEAAGNTAAVEALLARCLPIGGMSVEVWRFYVTFLIDTQLKPQAQLVAEARTELEGIMMRLAQLREGDADMPLLLQQRDNTRIAVERLDTALQAQRGIIMDAYARAVDAVGTCLYSAPLWRSYVEFVKQAPGHTATEMADRATTLRTVYEAALAVPHAEVSTLWEEYRAHVQSSCQPELAAKFIANMESTAATALKMLQPRMTAWQGLDTMSLPIPPTPPPPPAGSSSSAGSAAGGGVASTSVTGTAANEAVHAIERQAAVWRRILAWELANSMRRDKDALVKHMRYIFNACLAHLRFFPEVWYDALVFESDMARMRGVPVASSPHFQALVQGARALFPTCVALNLAIADMLELSDDTVGAASVYRSLLGALHRVADTRPALRKRYAAAQPQHVSTGSSARTDAPAAGIAASGPEGVDAPAPESDATVAHTFAVLADSDDAHDTLFLSPDEQSSAALAAAIDALPLASARSVASIHSASVPSDSDAASCAAAVSRVLISYVRFTRRTGGMLPARHAFKQARASPYVTGAVFRAAAQSEYFSNRALPVARNVLELGRQRFPHDMDFLLSAIDFLMLVDDATNVRAFLERTLADLPVRDSRPVWDRYIHMEMVCMPGGGSLSAVAVLERRRAHAHPQLASAQTCTLTHVMHRHMEANAPGDGAAMDGPAAASSAASAADAGLQRRFPFSPFSLISLPYSEPAAALLPSYASPATAVTVRAVEGEGAGRVSFDGLYLQAPQWCSTPLSHVPPAFWQPRDAAAALEHAGQAYARMPPALGALARSLPLVDATAPLPSAQDVERLLLTYRTTTLPGASRPLARAATRAADVQSSGAAAVAGATAVGTKRRMPSAALLSAAGLPPPKRR